MATIVKCDANLEICDFFTRLSSLYYATKDKRKGGTFSRVANVCAGYEEPITKDTDLTTHAGIGGSSQRELTQFLERGTSDRMIELLSNPDAPVETFQDKLVRLLTMQIGKEHEGRVKSSIILGFAMNRISNVEDALENVEKFDAFLREGLRELLPKIKEGKK